MVTRLSKASKALWGVLLFVLALRAVAGPALCDPYGEHQVPGGSAQAIGSLPHERHAASSHDLYRTPAQHPTPESGDHACEEPVYLTGEAGANLPVKWSELQGKAVWSYAPAAIAQPESVVVQVWPRRWAAPRSPSSTPLELTRRLRI
ncbi:MAG: hypothetical protein KIT60_19995 [Burkholderiaceae bacterium]|nr:hypothetical protein [Burkholderiaceae bacterium]